VSTQEPKKEEQIQKALASNMSRIEKRMSRAKKSGRKISELVRQDQRRACSTQNHRHRHATKIECPAGHKLGTAYYSDIVDHLLADDDRGIVGFEYGAEPQDWVFSCPACDFQATISAERMAVLVPRSTDQQLRKVRL
jgi:hypothetical protein